MKYAALSFFSCIVAYTAPLQTLTKCFFRRSFPYLYRAPYADSYWFIYSAKWSQCVARYSRK
jgi:hypothetical protein